MTLILLGVTLGVWIEGRLHRKQREAARLCEEAQRRASEDRSDA